MPQKKTSADAEPHDHAQQYCLASMFFLVGIAEAHRPAQRHSLHYYLLLDCMLRLRTESPFTAGSKTNLPDAPSADEAKKKAAQ